jgi:hypothetical protein
MSHGMLHHIEPKYSLKCCTYLIWFEVETWFEFELKTLEKINRKDNRNSRKIGKANSAQGSPLSPAHARAPVPARPCSWQADPACRRKPERPLSLALSLLRGADLSALLLSPTPTLPLSTPPTPPVSASLTSRPRSPPVDAPTTVRSPATTEPPRPARPPPLYHLHPLPSSLALSLALPTRTENLRHRPPTSTTCSVAAVAPVPRLEPR